MNHKLAYPLTALLAFFLFIPSSFAQLVNMEETWQEFLKNKKTVDISELVKPEKSQPANYIKYSLIYATKYFCADNIESTNEMVSEIEAMGKEIWDRVPGFESRYLELKEKIKAYNDLDPIWQRFKNDKSSVTVADVEAVPEAKRVCEKGTLCKYFYMISHDYLCDADLKNARHYYDTRIKKLINTTFNPHDIEGLGEETDKMTKYWAGMDELEPAWQAFEETGVSPGYDMELPVYRCYVIPNMKACVLKGTYDICKHGEEMLEKLNAFKRKAQHPIPDLIVEKMEWMEEEVANIKKDLTILNTFWKKFVRSGEIQAGINYKHEFACDREAEVKAYLMDGFSDPCVEGEKALEAISEIRKEHKPALASTTMDKLKELKGMVKKWSGDVAVLDEAWEDFVPDNKLSKEVTFTFDYCEPLAIIKAHIIDGTINVCDRGGSSLEAIENVMDENEVSLTPTMEEKLATLTSEANRIGKKHGTLQKAWDYLLETGEVSDDYEYDYGFECNRLLDVRAYLLDGYTNPCLSGNYGLGEVAKVRKKHNVTLGETELKMIKELKDRLANEGANVKKVTNAWEDFVPDNDLDKEIDFIFTYCDKIAECRAYIIDGTVNFCERGPKRLNDIYKLQEDYLLTLDRTMENKLEALHKRVEDGEDQAGLQKAWKVINNTDKNLTVAQKKQIEVFDNYCNVMDQCKAWAIKGRLNPCKDGSKYLNKIAYRRQKDKLRFGDDLDYQVALLETLVKKCK